MMVMGRVKMSYEIKTESPLAYFHDTASKNSSVSTDKNASLGAKFRLVAREQHICSHLNLRGDAQDPVFVEGISKILGMSLPIKPGHYHCVIGENSLMKQSLYWLGPDEWLLISRQLAEGFCTNLLETLDAHISITDVSGGQTLVNLSGDNEAIQIVLKKSSVYDFGVWESASESGGRCAQTTFGKTSALVSNKSNGSYDLLVRRSFADYFALWLLDAGREFGISILGPHPE
jgi:sarcosine oxidase subunit gamma